MRTILKKISLEGFTSRMPSVIPAYKDNKLYFFDDESLKERGYLYTSNYGMIPINVNVSRFTNHNAYGFCGCESSDDIKTFSFRSISKYYYFFKEYYHLLKDYGHCNMVYTSATQYYDAETKDPRYGSELMYGIDRATYEALDKDFINMGGKVSAITMESQYIVDVVDCGFYKFICENIIPSFTIPKKYAEYWRRSTLYYPDVIKWMGWLNTRLGYEDSANFKEDSDGVEHWNCKNNDVSNCCDCEDYFNRGGARTLSAMTTWYKNVQNGISNFKELVESNKNCFIPTMFQEINLITSIDNLGEMSILSEEYQLGKDYRNASGMTATKNSKSGATIVYEDGSSKILSARSGFCFDEKYMEKVFNEDDWGDYTRKYINDNSSEFKINYKYYAYDEDDKLITGDSENDVESKFFYYYDIITRDSILINGNLYDVLKDEYGIYNKKPYFVYRDKATNTPYTIINGKEVYAEFEPYATKPYYYFTIFKDENNDYKHFPRNKNEDDCKEYIIYNGATYKVETNGATIDTMFYNRIKGYSIDKYGETYYVLSDDTIKYTDILIDVPTDTEKSGNKLEVKFKDPLPIIYRSDTIIGRTSSKLETLRAVKPLSDDIGNELHGLYDVNNNYNFQPKQGSKLEPLYQVGNVYLGSDAQYINTQVDQYNITSATNYFVGSIIANMDFYYKDSDGSVDENTIVKLWLDASGNTSGNTNATTSLSAITESTNKKSNEKIYESNIYCDITYYQGATLSRKKGEKFILASSNTSSNNYNHGVKYTETVQFIKEEEEYYLKKKSNKFLNMFKNKAENHSVSYPVTVYKIKQETQEITTNDGKIIEIPMANFETNISIWSATTNNSSLVNTFDGKDITKDEEIYPTFMEEYRLGTASMQNVESNVFIDRGINAAFEKHIKLGECFTLEALENYTNGWFKMIEN